MVSLKNIKVFGVSHPNIFIESRKNKTLECIDMVFDIFHEVDRDSVDFKKYNLNRKCSDEDLIDCFMSYMVVWIEGDKYKKLDSMDYDDFNYMIFCDVSDNVDEVQDIKVEEMQKAFIMMKKYVKTKLFTDSLEREFNIL